MTASPFAVTLFDHRSARFKREVKVTLPELLEMIEVQTAERKDLLPLLKLARFGNSISAKASLRHDANLLAMSGCEGDYDGEQISVDRAREIIEKAGVEAVIYTSPSHTPDKPRFRLICPFSTELAPGRHAQMVARLNGLSVAGSPTKASPGRSRITTAMWSTATATRSPTKKTARASRSSSPNTASR
jgi:hypothetical protein